MKTILVDAVYAFVVKTEQGFSIYKPMHEMLDQFPNPKIVLTGADDEQMKEFGLTALPYELFSLKHHPEKSDPKYYTLMLEHFGLTAEDVVYFEHNADAVKSAQSVGITTYHYDPEARSIDLLRSFLAANLD